MKFGRAFAAAAMGLILAFPSIAAAAEPRFRIMMALWRGCEDACRGFQEYIWQNEIPAEIILRDVSSGNFSEFTAEARALGADLIVTWGTSATLGIVGTHEQIDPDLHITEIPVLFMIVTDPVAARVVPQLDKPGRNVTGTLVVVPEDVQLQAIRSYIPFERIGIAYNSDEVNAVTSVERLQQMGRKDGFTVIAREVPLDAQGKPDPARLPDVVAELAQEKVDLIYIGSSSFILVHREIFTKAAVEHGIPVAAAGEVPVVEADALMGLVSRYHTIGQMTGKLAEDILLNGQQPSAIPVEALSRFSLIVNMEVAHKLKLYPPLSLFKIVEIIKWEKQGQ